MYPEISESGKHSLAPRLAGEAVKDSPFIVEVDSGDADPNGTTITLNKKAKTGDSAARIELKDKFGNRRVKTQKDQVTISAKSTKVCDCLLFSFFSYIFHCFFG